MGLLGYEQWKGRVVGLRELGDVGLRELVKGLDDMECEIEWIE